MRPLPITHFTATSALGKGLDAHVEALLGSRTGLRKAAFDTNTLDCWIGPVADADSPLPAALAGWDCRNNRLAELALRQDGFENAALDCIARCGSKRVGVFVGTSTSGVQQTELAYRARTSNADPLPEWFDHRTTQNIFSCADFVATRLGASGPRFAISTACSSSAKVFAAAYRAIEMGSCDAAIVGGVDSLCLTTLYGFNSLQLISSEICRPSDARRNGISIGEGAGFALLDPRGSSRLSLLGYGETGDAHHMSSPDPNGAGAAAAMRAALDRANLQPHAIDYVNLHGTGTQANDDAESKAVCSLFGETLPCSSTKGWTGHTLGAAGIVEAAISLLCIREGFMPKSLNTQEKDPAISAAILLDHRRRKVSRVLSNSFGFGGSNCSLVFGEAP